MILFKTRPPQKIKVNFWKRKLVLSAICKITANRTHHSSRSISQRRAATWVYFQLSNSQFLILKSIPLNMNLLHKKYFRIQDVNFWFDKKSAYFIFRSIQVFVPNFDNHPVIFHFLQNMSVDFHWNNLWRLNYIKL